LRERKKRVLREKKEREKVERWQGMGILPSNFLVLQMRIMKNGVFV